MAMVSCRSQIMKSLGLLLLMVEIIQFADAGKKKNFCNVCRAVVDEANWRISQSDPKKTIQVGSFRVDPNGNQNIQEKSYARSEGHIEEIFESICEGLRDYAELSQDDGSTTVVRTRGRNGKRLETKDYTVDMAVSEKLRYECHDFLENHEENVMSLLQRYNIGNYEQIICGEQTSVCSGKELSAPLIELPEAVDEVLEEKDSEEKNEEEEADKTKDGEASEPEGEEEDGEVKESSSVPEEKDEL